MHYLKRFLVYSILGYLIEMTYYLFVGGGESGILYGPWTPIYGLGGVFIIILYRAFFYKRKHTVLKEITFIVCITILLTFLEWLGGTLIELIFGVVFWDYSGYRYAIGKYIALEMSLVWAFMSVLFIYVIKPLLVPFIKKIPNIITLIVLFLFLIDISATFIIKM